jgi:3-phenylpropionate/trans-cinnamate dioxygenase ferredoxin reductase component
MLASGEALGFDRLLLATGAEPRRLRLPGADLEGVLYLRTVEDSEAIRERTEASGRLVTIGAGWIGAEVAASARQRGCDVTILERADLPLERVLGPELGRIYRDIHTDHGVEFISGARVEGIEGDDKVAAVRLAGDRRIEADHVVVGVGVAPRVELAATAGLEIDNGVVCDERLRTSAPNVFAAGDVANALHPFYRRRLRVEHWFNALEQGPVAARNMLGREEPYEKLPYFFSDQYEVGMEYAGFATDWDDVVFRGDVEGREFIAFWLADGRVVAGMNVNVWEVTDQIQALIRARSRVDVGRLRDAGVPLDQLAPPAWRNEGGRGSEARNAPSGDDEPHMRTLSARPLLVDLVSLRALPAVRRLWVLGGMRVAGAGRAGLRVRLLAERLRVGVGRVARVLAAVVGVGPFGGVGLADRRAQRVVR